MARTRWPVGTVNPGLYQPGTVRKWRDRFLARRLDGLGDEPRPGVPRTITDAQVEEVVVRTLEETPEGATHWSKRELAKLVGISPTSVHRIWRAFGLQPWRTEDFKISPDPLLIDKIRDVIGLYLAPPANAAVFAVDEKPQIQALERTAPVLPMIPGVPERRSHDYVRHGTIDLFAALNTATAMSPGWADQTGTAGRCHRTWGPADRSSRRTARTASADSEVRPGPRLPTLRPCSVKIREAGPEALSTLSLPTMCGLKAGLTSGGMRPDHPLLSLRVALHWRTGPGLKMLDAPVWRGIALSPATRRSLAPTGDHHARTDIRATLLVRAVDRFLACTGVARG